MVNQKVYMWVGTFAVVMMLYLFIAPKLVKKTAGEPPRAGSNTEQMAIAQTQAQMVAPMVGGGGSTTMGAGNRLSYNLEGAGGGTPTFKIGQAYRGRRMGRRAFRGFKTRNPKMNLFPFANVALA